MIGGVTRRGGLPGLLDRVTLSAGVKFCHVNVSRSGNPPTRGRIRDASNSRKIHVGGGFSSLLKVTLESHNSTEGCSVQLCAAPKVCFFLAPFWSENGHRLFPVLIWNIDMIFQGTTGVYERIYRNYSPSLNFESFVLFETET